jgi:hypothetical protein
VTALHAGKIFVKQKKSFGEKWEKFKESKKRFILIKKILI